MKGYMFTFLTLCFLAQDNTKIPTVSTGTVISTDQLPSGAHAQHFKIMNGTNDATDKLIITSAGAAKVDGSAVTQPVNCILGCSFTGLTNTELRASPVPVNGTITIGNFPASQTVNGAIAINNFPAAQTVDGTVSVGNFPAIQNVNCVSGCSTVATPATYSWTTPDSVGGANKNHLDLFNAVGSGKVIVVRQILPIIRTEVAVTGAVAIRFNIFRTSTVGTGGTVAVYKSATADVAGGTITPTDTTYSNLPSQITARHLQTGGASASEWLKRAACFTEETNAATYLCSGQTNVLTTGIVLREGQGISIVQGAVASVNNIAFQLIFELL